MEPTAGSGDYLLVDPSAYRKALPRKGDVVIARHPWDHNRIITKRVQSVAEQSVELVSDNPGEGQDSRSFGPLPVALLCGKVTCVIR
jgi:nickel-type superoxide dismutase maturation protease